MAVKAAVLHTPAWSQVIVNPGFSADTDWTHNTGTPNWSIASGTARPVGSDGEISQTVPPLTNGLTYRTRLVITTYTSGGVRLKLGTAVGTRRAAAGTFDEDIVANGTGFAIECVDAGGAPAAASLRVDAVYAVPLVQTFTKTGFGTPKAARFVMALRGIVDGSAISNANFGLGICDASRQFCMMASAETAVSVTDNYKRISNTRCMGLLDDGSGTVVFDATFSSFGTDTVTVNITTLNAEYLSQPPQIEVSLYGGTDLDIYAGSVALTGSESSHGVTDPAFKPDQLQMFSIGTAAAWDTTYDGLDLCIGYVDWDGTSIVQCCHEMQSPDNLETSAPSNAVSTTYAILFGTPQLTVTVNSFDTNGFTVTNSNTDAGKFFYLAMKYNGKAGHEVGITTSATATGDGAFPSPGAGYVLPQYVTMCMSAATAINAACDTDTNGAGAFGVATFDSTAQSAVLVGESDNVGTTSTRSKTDSKSIQNWSGSGTVLHTATFNKWLVSDQIYGYHEHNFTVANATARKWATLVIGQSRLVSLGGYNEQNGRIVLVS